MPQQQDQSAQPAVMEDPPSRASLLLDLPKEIVDHILGYLPPSSLIDLALTSRALHVHANNEFLWASLVRRSLPLPPTSPAPFASWKEMYSSNYPYWFLPKNKLWFSDKGSLGGGMAGQLIIVRYNSRSGSIEGYRLLAEHPDQHIVDRWDLDDEVLIHHFTPKVQLFLENPVLTLNRDSYAAGNRMQQEIVIDRDTASHAHCIRSRLFLAQAIAPELQSPSMSLWPPLTLPATNRVRNTSSSLFLDNAHKPSKYSEISDTSFRIRKWMEFRAMRDHQGGNRAGGVLTFSTLPPESYTPTAEKPYQGIWVGDYSAHGCEFLLVLQKSPEEAARTPPIPRQKLAQEHFNSGPTSSSNHAAAPAPSPNDDTADAVGCSGRLEAIKLTGDPNVPRGEYTWIAEDISRKGQLRIAEEQMFAGARVVKSWGHIADQGFANDSYIPAQLILISHDCLAQYWEPFKHVSFFRRVDVDRFLLGDDEGDGKGNWEGV